VDPEHPQPVFARAVAPRELHVEFDRPVPAEMLRDVLSQSTLTAGAYVQAGDRFETLFPGYAAGQTQKMAPRAKVALHSAQLTPDGRTLVFATDPMVRTVSYALTLPGMGRPKSSDKTPPHDYLPQHADIDLDFDMTGCEATWTPADG